MATPRATPRKGTAKLSELLEIERSVQERWLLDKVFEMDAPSDGSAEALSVELFIVF